MVVVKALLDEGWKVEVEAEAVLRPASVVGIEGVIKTGLANMSAEERKKWDERTEPNLLLVPDEDEQK